MSKVKPLYYPGARVVWWLCLALRSTASPFPAFSSPMLLCSRCTRVSVDSLLDEFYNAFPLPCFLPRFFLGGWGQLQLLYPLCPGVSTSTLVRGAGWMLVSPCGLPACIMSEEIFDDDRQRRIRLEILPPLLVLEGGPVHLWVLECSWGTV